MVYKIVKGEAIDQNVFLVTRSKGDIPENKKVQIQGQIFRNNTVKNPKKCMPITENLKGFLQNYSEFKEFKTNQDSNSQ